MQSSIRCPKCGEQIALADKKKERDEGFEAFYAAYPRRMKPRDAKKAWQQTFNDRPSLDKIIEAVNRQRPFWKDSQFIPYPATWLRAHSWDDEIANSDTDNMVSFAIRRSPAWCPIGYTFDNGDVWNGTNRLIKEDYDKWLLRKTI